MKDETFGELSFDCGFEGKKTIDFFGEEQDATILICADEEESGVSELQRQSFEYLMENWEDISHKIAMAILEYYNSSEKGSYGPDDPEEMAEWWPDIETEEDVARNIHLDSIVISEDDIIEDQGGNAAYVLFDRDWGGEDTEVNGVAVLVENGEVVEVDYKYIAF